MTVITAGTEFSAEFRPDHGVYLGGVRLRRRTTKVATVALANKTARIVWAIMSTGEAYREPVLQAA